MVSILQPRSMPFESFGHCLLLAGTTLAAQTATRFEIRGPVWTWVLSGRDLTYDAAGNLVGGALQGFNLYRGAPAGGNWALVADTNFGTITPAVLTEALALHAAGQTQAAAALLNETLLAEPYAHTRYVGGLMHGTATEDYLFMSGPPSRAYGYGGEDSINFGASDDSGYGGDDRDWLRGGGGADRLWGDSGGDLVYGEDGDDRLHGGADNDFLSGGRGDDLQFGGEGNDGIDGGTGNDTAYGGAGNDRLMAGRGDDGMFGQAGDDTLEGGGGVDWIGGGTGHDRLYGGADNDTLAGDGGNDTLFGNDGDDRMSGGLGDESLFGGNGDDTLSGDTGRNSQAGGAGADTFVMRGGATGASQDVILDYTPGEDRLLLADFGFATVDDALAHAVDTAVGVQFHFAPNQSLIVLRTAITAISADILLA